MRWMILAGLTLAGSVSAQTIYRCEVDGMQALGDRYDSRIEVEQRAIDRLRDDLARIRD